MAVQPGFAYASVDFSGVSLPFDLMGPSLPPVDFSGVSLPFDLMGPSLPPVDFSATSIQADQVGQLRVDFLSLGQSITGAFYTRTGRSGRVLEATINQAFTTSVFMQDAVTGFGLAGLAGVMVIRQKKPGGGFVIITPAITDRSFGRYDLAFTGGHLDTLKVSDFHITAPGAYDNDDLQINVIAIDKNDAVHLGLSSLPNAVPAVAGGLPLTGTQIPTPAAGAAGGLPLLNVQIPLAAAGTNTGLPVVGTQIPLAVAGTNTGLPVVGNQIPNAMAGTLDGLPTAEQVANIAVTSAALNQTAASRVITTGTEVGVLANTDTLDGVFHTFTDVAGVIDFYYEFDVSTITGAVGVGLQWKGYLNGALNTMKVYAWNWISSLWDQLGFISGSGDTVVYGGEYELTNSNTSAGLVRLRFANTGLTAATFASDRVLLGYVVQPAATAVTVNAILDELLSGHSVVGSVADGIAIAAGLLQGNFFMDQTTNTNPNGQTAARLRVFRTGVATAAATDGGIGEGEFATFLVTTDYVGPNKIKTHRVVRQ